MQVWRYSLTFCEQSFLPESTRKEYIVCFLYLRLCLFHSYPNYRRIKESVLQAQNCLCQLTFNLAWVSTFLYNRNVEPYRPSRSLRSASMRLLTIPSAKLKKYGCRSFSSAAPSIWNSLPESLRNHDDISKFKTPIKTFLF